MAVWFTSDTHFTDPRVLRLDRRPYASLADHDAALIAQWNAVVGEDDEIWHLGDFARTPDAERVGSLLAMLNGRKHLIVGNNDGPQTVAAIGWASVQHYAELSLDGRRLVLCHYPFRTWNGMHKGALDLHGHSHGKLKPMTRQYDVGVDAWAFRPIALADMLGARRRATPARQAPAAETG